MFVVNKHSTDGNRITQPPGGLNLHEGMQRSQFFPKTGDIHPHYIQFRVTVVAPDPFHKLLHGDDLAGIGKKHFHHLVFPVGETDGTGFVIYYNL